MSQTLINDDSAIGSEFDSRSKGCEFDPGRSRTFAEIDHEIISTVIVVSFMRKCAHEVLVNCLI